MYSQIFNVNSPWVFKSVNRFDVNYFGSVEAEFAPDVVEVSGLCMNTSVAFYNELSRAFLFPEYSGHNFNALFDSLTDLVWIKKTGLLLVVHDAEVVLQDEAASALSGFVETLERVGQDWARRISSGSEWDRPAIPFNSYFEIKSADSRSQYIDITEVF